MAEPRFWESKTLEEMSQQEWESLCDGCGKCCLQKLEDEEDGRVYTTALACRHLNLKNCQCGVYGDRLKEVPDCLELTPANLKEWRWLPSSCAYRLVAEGKPLPRWHHLICGSRQRIHRAGRSVAGQVFSEDEVPEDEWEEYIIRWVN